MQDFPHPAAGCQRKSHYGYEMRRQSLLQPIGFLLGRLCVSGARWMDHDAMQRATVTIFELIDSENVRARKITAAVDADDMDLVFDLRKQGAPLATLDELLKVLNLPIDISIEKDDQLYARKSGGALVQHRRTI